MRLLESDIVTPALLHRFQFEGEFEGANGQHYALILRDNDADLLAHHPGSPQLHPNQMIWAGDVLRLLNKELHHDGAWVVCFTHPRPVELAILNHAHYDRYALIWLDSDGDPQFTVEWMAGVTSDLQDFADVMLCGIESTVEKCETAWMEAELQRQALDARKGRETFRRARGERAPSVVNGYRH